MRLVLVQILAQTRQTSLRAILDFLTVADENAAIAHGLIGVTRTHKRCSELLQFCRSNSRKRKRESGTSAW
jgi:hypothetical protein